MHSQQTQQIWARARELVKVCRLLLLRNFGCSTAMRVQLFAAGAWGCQLCQLCTCSSRDSRVAQLQQFGVTDAAAHFDGGAAKSTQAPSAKTRHVLRGRAGMAGMYVTVETLYNTTSFFHIHRPPSLLPHSLRLPCHLRIIRSDQILRACCVVIRIYLGYSCITPVHMWKNQFARLPVFGN